VKGASRARVPQGRRRPPSDGWAPGWVDLQPRGAGCRPGEGTRPAATVRTMPRGRQAIEGMVRIGSASQGGGGFFRLWTGGNALTTSKRAGLDRGEGLPGSRRVRRGNGTPARRARNRQHRNMQRTSSGSRFGGQRAQAGKHVAEGDRAKDPSNRRAAGFQRREVVRSEGGRRALKARRGGWVREMAVRGPAEPGPKVPRVSGPSGAARTKPVAGSSGPGTGNCGFTGCQHSPPRLAGPTIRVPSSAFWEGGRARPWGETGLLLRLFHHLISGTPVGGWLGPETGTARPRPNQGPGTGKNASCTSSRGPPASPGRCWPPPAPARRGPAALPTRQPALAVPAVPKNREQARGGTGVGKPRRLSLAQRQRKGQTTSRAPREKQTGNLDSLVRGAIKRFCRRMIGAGPWKVQNHVGIPRRGHSTAIFPAGPAMEAGTVSDTPRSTPSAFRVAAGYWNRRSVDPERVQDQCRHVRVRRDGPLTGRPWEGPPRSYPAERPGSAGMLVRVFVEVAGGSGGR